MKKQTVKSRAEQLLLVDLAKESIEPDVGVIFHGSRLWKFDFAYPGIMLAIEVDGKGRHQTDAGRTADCDKHNAALELGWRVLRYPAGRVTVNKRRARIVEQIKRIVCGISCEDSMSCVLVGE